MTTSALLTRPKSTPKKDLFSGEWRRKQHKLRTNASYRAKRVDELLLHIDFAAYLYACVIVQRSCAAVGCKATKEFADVPKSVMDKFWDDTKPFLDMVRNVKRVQAFFRDAGGNTSVEKLISDNEGVLIKAHQALREERRWLSFVNDSDREAVHRKLNSLITALDAEQVIDQRNVEAEKVYDELKRARKR